MSNNTIDSESTLRCTLVNCLTQQLGEFELLKSMYPDDDEMVLSDSKVLKEIENFLSGNSDYLPTHLDFILNLLIDKIKLEICINLPSFYPNEKPNVIIRCNQLNRYQETNLNNELSTYIQEIHLGDVCLYTIVSWIQEKIHDEPVSNNHEEKNTMTIEDKFSRYWIHSHHIYNKKKREEIINKAKEYNLTGFCLPGKPGIVCIEGKDNDCKVWWKKIKYMNWKKISIKKTEVFDLCEQLKEQKFQNFQELYFQNCSSKNSKHADMSGFSKYMEEYGFTQTFNDVFGLCKDI